MRRLNLFYRPYHNAIDQILDPIENQIIVSSLNNKYMPLLRYETGDIGKILENEKGIYFKEITGRKHDKIILNNKLFLTHQPSFLFVRYHLYLNLKMIDSL